jgi:hypothetical protein
MDNRALKVIRLLAFGALTLVAAHAVLRGQSLQSRAVFLMAAAVWLRTP